MDQQVSPFYHSFLTATQSYDSKGTHIGGLHAEKICEAVLLYVFRITFSATPLVMIIKTFKHKLFNLNPPQANKLNILIVIDKNGIGKSKE